MFSIQLAYKFIIIIIIIIIITQIYIAQYIVKSFIGRVV